MKVRPMTLTTTTATMASSTMPPAMAIHFASPCVARPNKELSLNTDSSPRFLPI